MAEKPALFAPMRERFVGAIKTYATTQDIPLITFERGQRKDDVVAAHRAQRRMDDGGVVIGVAQEKMRAFKAQKLPTRGTAVSFDFSRQSVAVNHYYFYVQGTRSGGRRFSSSAPTCRIRSSSVSTATSG